MLKSLFKTSDSHAQPKVSAITLRAVGASTGFKVKLPPKWSDLLELSSRLVLGGNKTTNIFDRQGDKLVDIDVISPGDILYVSSDGSWQKPKIEKSTARERRQAAKSTIQQQQQQQTVHAPLAAVLLSEALRKTPVRRADETPARLCSGKPPYGLMGDPSQLGSGEVANFSRLRGAARAQAHVQLCMRTARRMQARNLESVGNKNPFPMGATCAIVGSSGSLTRSGHGRAIDAHRVVMRFNLAPAGGEWAADVGNRTTVRILTDKVVAPFMKSAKSKPGNGALSRFGRAAEPESVLLLYCMAQGWVGKCMHEQRVGHVNPVFLKHLRAVLDLQSGRGRLPSAGLAGMAMAISHCSRVTLYGFGNASDARGNGTGGHAAQCGHYWDCKRHQDTYFAGKQGYHDWAAQWRVLSGWIDTASQNASTRGALQFIDGGAGEETQQQRSMSMLGADEQA